MEFVTLLVIFYFLNNFFARGLWAFCIGFENMEDDKKRAPNFTNSEKELLLTVVAEYKDIIECKRRDGANWRAKEDAWVKVSHIYNAQSMTNIHRSKEALKKCYENLKHSIKIDAANEKSYIKETGGGASI